MNPKNSPNAKYLYAFVIIIITIIVLWSLLNGSITTKELSGPLLAVLGTFFGALFAFRLNENKDYLKGRLENKAALSRALFTLARQANAINSIIKLLEPYKTDTQRALNLPAYKPPTYSDLKHNFEDLEFLLETEYINLLMRLTVEQERFHQGFESLRIRSDFYISEVLPQMSLKSLQGKNLTDDELLDALGERIYETSVNYAKNLYFLFYENQKSIKQAHSELFNTAKKLFPKDKFIKPIETE